VGMALAGRRMAGDLAQLHLGHHRQSEGRGVSPPRRLPERRRQHPGLGHAAAFGVPVDAADVPLQRLVLSLDDGRERGDQRVPAPGRCGDDLPVDQAASRHALLRRAGGPSDAHQRARGDEAGNQPPGERSGRRGGAAGGHDRRHAEDGLQHHPRVRSHRDLRPGNGLREAPGMGPAAPGGASGVERTPGRALSRRGSCSAATSR